MSQTIVESLVKLFSLREAFHPTAFMQMIFYGQFVSFVLGVAFMFLVVNRVRSDNADGLQIYKEYLHHLRKRKKIRRIISLIRPSKKSDKSVKPIKVLCQHKEQEKTSQKKTEVVESEADADDFDERESADLFKPSARSILMRKSDAVIRAKTPKNKSRKEEKKTKKPKEKRK